jgi:pimeloyl-ACP methyl ester carboxylesterase
VIAKLSDVLPNVEVVTLPGAGHIPHVTLPDAYVEAIMAFIRKNPA